MIRLITASHLHDLARAGVDDRIPVPVGLHEAPPLIGAALVGPHADGDAVARHPTGDFENSAECADDRPRFRQPESLLRHLGAGGLFQASPVRSVGASYRQALEAVSREEPYHSI